MPCFRVVPACEVEGQHQPYRLVRQPATSSDERSPQPLLGHLDMPPASFRSQNMNRFRVPSLLVVISFHPTRLGADGRSLIGHQLLGRLVETDHGMVPGTGPARPPLPRTPRSRGAPLLLLPRFESIWRTVRGRCSRLATTFGAVGSSSPRVLPSLDGYQMCFLSAVHLRFCPGRGRSLSALSSPSFTKCAHVRPSYQ